MSKALLALLGKIGSLVGISPSPLEFASQIFENTNQALQFIGVYNCTYLSSRNYSYGNQLSDHMPLEYLSINRKKISERQKITPYDRYTIIHCLLHGHNHAIGIRSIGFRPIYTIFIVRTNIKCISMGMRTIAWILPPRIAQIFLTYRLSIPNHMFTMVQQAYTFQEILYHDITILMCLTYDKTNF